jgi:uncharacterized protein (TIGR02594 family)
MRWLDEALKDLGTKEQPGPGSNPDVVTYYAESGNPGVKDDGVAWCAAFVGAMLSRAGLQGTRSLAARSYLNYGSKLPTSNIPRGAILVFRRGNSSWQGHVAFCVRDLGSRVEVIGGNQNNAVTFATYPKSAILPGGVRWPETALNSRTLQSGGLSFASLGASEITETLETTQSLAAEWAPYLRVAQYVLLAVALIAAGYAAYRFIRKRIRPVELPEIEDGPAIDGDVIWTASGGKLGSSKTRRYMRRPNKRKRRKVK